MEELSKIIKSYREKSNFSLDEISEKTKIRKFVLNVIEEGDFSKLPPVYGKSFVKEYIDFLQIPAEEYEEHYRNLLQNLNVTKTEYNPIKGTDYGKLGSAPKFLGIEFTPSIINIGVYSVVAVILIILIYIGVFYKGQEEYTETSTSIPVDSVQIDELVKPIEPLVRDSITLEAFAIDSSWIKIEIDGVNTTQTLMAPNTRKTWKAKEYFVIHQGNVGALEIKRNGELLEPFGSPGSFAKNVKVTGTRVIKR